MRIYKNLFQGTVRIISSDFPIKEVPTLIYKKTVKPFDNDH